MTEFDRFSWSCNKKKLLGLTDTAYPMGFQSFEFGILVSYSMIASFKQGTFEKILLLTLIILAPCRVLAKEPRPGQKPPDGNTPVFARIALAASNVKNLACDFLEEKHLAILKETVFSRGRFYFQKPDRLRWELIEPAPSGFAVYGNRAKRWRGQNGSPESFELQQQPAIKVFADQLFAWVRADFEWLEQGYHITVLEENPVALKLVPISSSARKYLDHLLIFFAADCSHVTTVEIHEADGDYTRIRFVNMVVNGALQKDLF